jgi:prepilin-type N-terminal cleavage/methylation domain-containing protein
MKAVDSRSDPARAARGEAGFTLIELMAAAVVLAIGIMALTSILISSRQLVNDSERRAAASHIAEDEVEDVLSMPYDDIALTSLPTSSSDAFDPDFYVNGSTYRPDHSTGGSTAYEGLLDGGTLEPSTEWTDGRLSGEIHRYVTETDVGPADPVKRVTIAVTVDSGERRIRPVTTSAVVAP